MTGDPLKHQRAVFARRRALRWMTLSGSVLVPSGVQAQGATAYPNKPIRLVVGYPPGGSGDFITRVAADELARELGVQIVVENRAGAGGTMANEQVSKSAADGYTVLNAGPFALTQALYRKLSYDGNRDFIPVSRLAVGPMIICVNLDLPVRNLQDLIAHAKANPGKLNIASSGNGSTPHLAGALFETVAGVQMVTVQFKGGGPAASSTIAGDTHVMFATPPTVINFIKAGRLRALALTTAEPSAAIPGIPGAARAGLPGYDTSFSFGLYMPVSTPEPIVRRFHEAVLKAMTRPGVKERVATQGMDVAIHQSPELFADSLRNSADALEKLVRMSGARLE